MSEESPESTGAGTAQVDDGAGTGTDPEDQEGSALLSGMLDKDPEKLATELEQWKSRARQWENRSKGNADAAKELAELKKSQMSAIERAEAERADAIRERDEARADHSRVMAAAAHNLPVELIDYLGSGTDEEINTRSEAIAGAIETRAQEIAQGLVEEMLKNGSRNGSMGARPVESMRAGSAPSTGAAPADANAWLRQMLTGRD